MLDLAKNNWQKETSMLKMDYEQQLTNLKSNLQAEQTRNEDLLKEVAHLYKLVKNLSKDEVFNNSIFFYRHIKENVNNKYLPILFKSCIEGKEKIILNTADSLNVSKTELKSLTHNRNAYNTNANNSELRSGLNSRSEARSTLNNSAFGDNLATPGHLPMKYKQARNISKNSSVKGNGNINVSPIPNRDISSFLDESMLSRKYKDDEREKVKMKENHRDVPITFSNANKMFNLDQGTLDKLDKLDKEVSKMDRPQLEQEYNDLMLK